MRSSATIAYKLACEFAGSQLAEWWHIPTPEVSLINIRPQHWQTVAVQHNMTAATIGFNKLDNVIDITPTTFSQVYQDESTIYGLLKIALFDFWVANEDRTSNNANLLYYIEHNQLISIDYGGLFNNVTFDFPATQLTETDSILTSDLSTHLLSQVSPNELTPIVNKLYNNYIESILQCEQHIPNLYDGLPKEWAIPKDKFENKLKELTSPLWKQNTWNNFVECLKSNSSYGKQS